jgi:hypothetical protein
MSDMIYELYRHQQEKMRRLEADRERLRAALENVFNAGMRGIGHVGAANYASREREAMTHLRDVYDAARKEADNGQG